jgi:hypothetical protein
MQALVSSYTSNIFIYSLPQSTPVFTVLEKSLQALQNNCFKHYKLITFCLIFSITHNHYVVLISVHLMFLTIKFHTTTQNFSIASTSEVLKSLRAGIIEFSEIKM